LAKLTLKHLSPSEHPACRNQAEALILTKALQKKLYDLLYLMFAEGKHSLLIILQGIDTAGKDGTVRHIFSAANPQGIKVFSFKQPTPDELRHDFLWRCHFHTPESGFSAIFNRSYYEEVTTVMVHPELLKAQHVPKASLERSDFYERRYRRINDFEKLLTQKGTVIVKFFLHISKAEQGLRIEERLQNRSKNWKFSTEDVKERRYWDEYMLSFEKMLSETTTKRAPWTVVPSDHKWYRDYIVSKTLVEALEDLKMDFPKITGKFSAHHHKK
jgi:PPK2 family polyphosphate:nucleotide phosphotransferase